jgi:hypothetical protein
MSATSADNGGADLHPTDPGSTRASHTHAGDWVQPGRAVYAALAPRACSAILFGALFCNLAVKLFHAIRCGLLVEYPIWILTDIAVLVTMEIGVTLICWRWPRKRVIRSSMIFAVVVCTWSVMNAGWLIRTGTQILPMEFLPLFRDPVSALKMIVLNLWSMPWAAAALVTPSVMTLAFFFSVLARPPRPHFNPARLRTRILISLAIGVAAAIANLVVSETGLKRLTAPGVRSNCQVRAVLAFLLPRYHGLARNDFSHATRELPRADTIPIALKPRRVNHNVVIVVLEGIQYDCTSLAAVWGGIAPQDAGCAGGPTPFLLSLAGQGASFTNARAVVTHTTKALFGLLTGRVPSASQDLPEAIPTDPPYASLATILEKGLGFRTAFFQSAAGNFEGRPGLIHNLGFQKFWARDDLHDPNRFVGYLGCDEFALLGPMAEWIRSDDKPFLLVALCSVTHDPYEAPRWYGPAPTTLADRYLQTVSYTDQFLAALDVELADLGRTEDTIFCVVGDHGEGFGEHGILGHERLAFEEVLRIALCIRAPFMIEPGTRITAPVNSLDLTPTILTLLGFDIEPMHFDGADALAPLPADRQVYFAGWMQQGPAGFIQGSSKYVYDPERDSVSLCRLSADPLELSPLSLPPEQAARLSRQIIAWRRGTIFRLDQAPAGQITLFDTWRCKWNKTRRTCTAKYLGP